MTYELILIGITRFALFVALAGSFRVMVRGKRCSTCQLASTLTGGLPLGPIGTALYPLALLATFLPNSAPAAWALAAAAGVHAVLAGLLLRHRVLCRTCLLTASAALLAAAGAIMLDPAGNALAALAAPLTGLATWFGVGMAATAAFRRSMRQADRLLADAAQNEPPVAPGRVRVIVLAKPDCGARDFLKDAVLPELQSEFAAVMDVEFRPAAAGVPAPTLLILGKASVPFIGAAPAEAIAPAIRMALGQMPEPGEEMREAVTVPAVPPFGRRQARVPG